MRVVQILQRLTLPAMKNNASRTVICCMTWRLVLGGLLAASSSACSNDELPVRNVGNTADGLELAPVTTPVVTGNARFAGHWLGETEDPLMRDAEGKPANYAFPSGSRQVALDLALQSDLLQGNITFGSGVPPEPEAGVSYPPGVNYGLPTLVVSTYPIEGFAYGLADVTADRSTGDPDQVVLSYEHFAGFTTWCPLQPALPVGDGGYNCSGGGTAGGEVVEDGSRQCFATLLDQSEQPMDCDYLSLCFGEGPCVCDAVGCAVDRTEANLVFLQFVDGEITAAFLNTAVTGGALGAIRFQRAAN